MANTLEPLDDTGQGSGVATYTRMDEGTVEDYAVLEALARPYIARTADRVLTHLELLADGLAGNLIGRYQHSLQTATRAENAGECEEMVVAALLYDVGDVLAPEDHSAMAAAVLRPYVARHTHWMVQHHGVFQGYYWFDKIGLNPDERERYRGHPAFDLTERFCYEYDQKAFDPAYETRSIDHFVPMVERVFARKPWGAHTEVDLPVSPNLKPLRHSSQNSMTTP